MEQAKIFKVADPNIPLCRTPSRTRHLQSVLHAPKAKRPVGRPRKRQVSDVAPQREASYWSGSYSHPTNHPILQGDKGMSTEIYAEKRLGDKGQDLGHSETTCCTGTKGERLPTSCKVSSCGIQLPQGADRKYGWDPHVFRHVRQLNSGQERDQDCLNPDHWSREMPSHCGIGCYSGWTNAPTNGHL